MAENLETHLLVQIQTQNRPPNTQAQLLETQLHLEPRGEPLQQIVHHQLAQVTLMEVEHQGVPIFNNVKEHQQLAWQMQGPRIE